MGVEDTRTVLPPDDAYTAAMEPQDRAAGEPAGIAIDPVCGMQVVIEGAVNTTELEGVTYYFCGTGCRLDFEEDPDRFLDPSYIPSM
jgi:YHS domain-containing protein